MDFESYTLTLLDDRRIVEGSPAATLLGEAADVDRTIEACWGEQAQAVLLYAANLPVAFFDISSGVAGHILQKLRNYRIRFALVVPPGSTSTSTRFAELVADEQRGREFGIFADRAAALAWLAA